MDNFTNPGDGVTFTWPAPVLSAGITGGTARSNASSANISDTFVNLTGSAGIATYTVTPIYNGCTGTPVEIVVNVNPQPILANLNTTVCSNTATGLMLSVATGSVPATSYNVTNIRVATRLETVRVATVSNNVSDSYLSNDIFRNRTGAPLNVIYTVAPVSADGCVGAAQEITVAINPEPVIRPNQTPVACSNAPINYEILLIPANIPAGTTFSWNAPVISDGSVQGTAGVNVPADPAGSFHITDAIVNRTGSDITATYSVTPTSGNGCVGETVDIVVVIHPEPITSEITGERFLCLGANSVMYSVDNHENSTYTWDVPAGFTVQFNNNN